MFRKIGLPIIAIVGFLFAGIVVILQSRKIPSPPLQFQPPKSPYVHFVAASGIVEASSENISIGVPFSGIVLEVYVIAGDLVEKGDPLFKIDDRLLQAQLEEAKSARGVAVANFKELLGQPRVETVPPAIAQVKQAEVNYENAKTRFALFQNVSDKRAISLNDWNQNYYDRELTCYQLQQAQAQLDLLLSGAWVLDLEIASAQIDQAEKTMEVVATDIERCYIRAPIKGQVLQVNVRVGELALQLPIFDVSISTIQIPLMIFGSIDPVHIRVDIDEEDAWRVRKGAPATAFVRGNSSILTPLEFVRFEPYVIPKTSLTGANTERVDTRVLQAIYSFNRRDLPIYLGQIMDVFIEAPPYLPYEGS